MIRYLESSLALVLGSLAAPVIGIAALCIWLEDAAPPFFCQPRVGQGGRLFSCYKLRSMHTNQRTGWVCSLPEQDAARPAHSITRVGRWLRRTSLDELPQLWNIVKGDMRFVGPRPIIPEEIPLYGVRFETYCKMPPGLTGLYQISGRKLLSFPERVALDTAQVQQPGWATTVYILWRTIPAVLSQRGAE